MWRVAPDADADDECRDAWRAAARAITESQVAASLIGPGDIKRNAAGAAWDYAVAGRWSDARQVLATSGVAAPSAEPGVMDAVLAAVHAASGDEGAVHWLSVAAARASGLLPLVAAAAVGRGDDVAAADAWRALAATSAGAVPWEHRLVDAVAGRERRVETSVAESVVGVTTMITESGLGAGQALATARALDARGDRAGAALVLRCYDRLVDSDPEVRAQLRAWRPRVAPGVVLGGLAVVAGLLSGAFLLAVIAMTAWRRQVPMRGLTLPESVVWRGIARYHLGPDDDLVVRGRVSAWSGIGAVVGFGIGLAMMVVAPGLIGGLGLVDAGWLASIWGTMANVSALLACTMGAMLATHAFMQRVERRRAGLVHADREEVARRCRCRELVAVTGRAAARHRAHLVATSQPAPLAGCEVERCPEVGALWLCGPIGDNGRLLALRGSMPRPLGADLTTTGGFYL